MQDLIRQMLLGQYEAALCMMHNAIAACPAEAWEGKIANGSARWAAYHTLFFTDYYLSKGDDDLDLHELTLEGGSEAGDEPAAGLPIDKSLAYVDACRDKARRVLAAETEESFRGDNGFGRKFSRAEMHAYNIRHIQHHAGQLSAYVRRMLPDFPHRGMPWIGSGWRD